MHASSEPQRSCTGCGVHRDKRDLVRIVVDPGGRILADLKGRLPSRGAYVCPDAGCIRRAAKGRLAAALRLGGTAKVDADSLRGEIERGLRERALALVGLAQKGGKTVSGANLVSGEVRRTPDRGWIALLAEDASEDIREGAERLLEARGVVHRRMFTRDELGLAIGKSPRSVVLVKDSGLAAALRETVDRIRQVHSQGGSSE